MNLIQLRIFCAISVMMGFADMGELWREQYEDDTFVSEVEELLQTLIPIYQQLHAYVRRKLIQRYPGRGIKPDGPIPAHLIGNMWGETYDSIYDILKPYPNKEAIDVTSAMRRKGMKPLDMFKMSEEFFTSLGFDKMTPEFWKGSIIEKPKDVEMVCHASAWNFFHGNDYRIKMCTTINMADIMYIHHEMGHIEYYMEYAHQPVVFRNGANPGFHEAVGDVLALSVATPKHLKEVGLLGTVTEDEEADINYLLKMALDKFPAYPFAYTMDAWRWKVFSGDIGTEELNSKWWEMRLKYQGLCPPVRRTNEDLDAAAKYHIAANAPGISYFVSYVIQFQFHKALCEVAGHQGPLHKCDIYGNKDAGKLLRDMLSLGNSRPWKEAMKIITRGKTDKMDVGPLIEYFEPLMKWLKEHNKNETVGWNSNDPMQCP